MSEDNGFVILVARTESGKRISGLIRFPRYMIFISNDAYSCLLIVGSCVDGSFMSSNVLLHGEVLVSLMLYSAMSLSIYAGIDMLNVPGDG